MDSELISFDLPVHVSRMLVALVDVAEKHQVLNVLYIATQQGSYQLSVSGGGERTYIEEIPGDPLDSLETIGLLRKERSKIYLSPAAFDRARFERMGRFRKWVTRAAARWREPFLAIAFVLSVWLTVLQVLELLAGSLLSCYRSPLFSSTMEVQGVDH